MRRVLTLAAILASLSLPAAAHAESDLGWEANGAGTADDVVTVGGSDVQGYQVKYSVGCFSGICAFTVASVNGFDAVPAECTSAVGNTEMSCDGDAAAGVQPPGNARITGSDGGDTIEGSCFFFNTAPAVDAGAGNDRVTLTCNDGVADLGPGDDDGSFGPAILDPAPTTMIGGDGDDRITGAGNPDTFRGDAGRDFLQGGAGNDNLDGGAGNDVVDGGDGADTVAGSPGRDTLDGGFGRDVITGGEGVDTVSYEGRAGHEPVAISLDGSANDGGPGENDALAADLEDAIGGAGGDTITGNAGPNELDGGDGGDVMDGLGGPDTYDGGPGNDRIASRDGVQEAVACGEGNDLAVTDEFDIVSDCETVQASRELMADVDNDGIAAPLDCDDRDPRRRPGLPDRPGNRRDENCDGRDAPFARVITPVQSLFSTSDGRTRVLRLRVVDVPAGAVIQLRCKGGARRGCFNGVRRFRVPRGAARKNVRGPVRNRVLEAGARLELRILVPDAIGKVVRFTARSGARLPASRLLCLRPGTQRPRRC